jgi:hypothetical protein
MKGELGQDGIMRTQPALQRSHGHRWPAFLEYSLTAPEPPYKHTMRHGSQLSPNQYSVGPIRCPRRRRQSRRSDCKSESCSGSRCAELQRCRTGLPILDYAPGESMERLKRCSRRRSGRECACEFLFAKEGDRRRVPTDKI